MSSNHSPNTTTSASWSLAGGFLSGKYGRSTPPSAGTRFAEAGQFVPFDKEMGYRVVNVSAALAWLLSKPGISSVIVADRKAEHLEHNIQAVDLQLTEDDLRQLDTVSDPGTPYPKWMVLQLDTAEDPRSKMLHPERFAGDGPLRKCAHKGPVNSLLISDVWS